MSTINFRQVDGSLMALEIDSGTSVMRAALNNGVKGIIGECGGQAMCATCHVYVVDSEDLPPVGDDEDAMLDCTADERLPNSRLSCQIVAGRDFDVIDVQIPASQI